MYFKIEKDTATGQKAAQIYQRMKAADQAAKDLVGELGGDAKYINSKQAAGGFTGIMFKEKPEGWKLTYSHFSGDFYFPKTIKRNEALLNRINALPKVNRQEINKLVGFEWQVVGDKMYGDVGFSFSDNHFLILVNDNAQYTPNCDMTELTYSQYKAIKDEIEAKSELAN